MIVTIAGRLNSGKGELASLFEKRGFIKLKFADALKDLLCEFLGIDRETLEKQKEDKLNFKFNTQQIEILAKKLNVAPGEIAWLVEDKVFSSIRILMQFIGTEVIRYFEPKWHIEQLANKLEEGKNYIIDDCRFPDEKNFLLTKGSHFWFVFRPGLFNISNHISETSLRWGEFDNLILNDNINEVKEIIDNRLDKMIENNDLGITLLYRKKNYSLYERNDFNSAIAKILIGNGQFTVINNTPLFLYYSNDTSANAVIKQWSGVNDNYLVIDDPLLLENLKYWF